MSEAVAIVGTVSDTQPGLMKMAVGQAEVEFAMCECCGLTEECTPAYIGRVRDRFGGRWICGLCSVAVDDEICRSDRIIGMEEALDRHMNFCSKFRTSAPPKDSTEHLISAMRQILRRSLDSPARVVTSTPNSPTREKGGVPGAALARSGSWFTTLAG